MKGTALARNNGRVAAACGLSVSASNPYGRSSRLYAAFVEGFLAAPEGWGGVEIAGAGR